MIRKIYRENMGKSNLGWLKSNFHFSFAEYYNPSNINFGVLRVLNDDVIDARTGFDTHPHKDMEIITYVINGDLTHKDSMGNEKSISRGHVQYMSAGSGVFHSEYNLGEKELRLLQLWIFPNERNLTPNYGDNKFNWEDREGKWLHMVSGKEGDAEIKINQDANIYSLFIEEGESIDFKLDKNRQGYLVQIEGSANVNNEVLNHGDALEVVEEDINIKGITKSHYLLVEMKKQY
ncbi:pirin family protein [Clostridium hydrogeniformans]|uniref:pirin family protein n=1 Tax=Clostridium hydrogeniformans TaxID=349933 RepID=UPI0004827B6F|nr:pirin family protein [Clostridium hydrogeniformans]